MKKRIVSLLVAAAMLTMMLPSAFAASTVTRAEWIEQLVDALSMTVESDDNMPDNYFSDISEDDSYYRDILVAVEFGVIDLEEGEDFEPTKSATREFAAQTLNSALQFQLDEDSSYTFSESGDVTYPDDIQVAINRGWFALSGGKALPYTAITSAEATAMLDDAKAVIADEAVDENYNSTYTFANGVKEIPKDTDVTIGSDNTVTITDYENTISGGDIFVVYNSGYPVPFKAVSVEKNDNQTIITTTKDGTDDAILSADAEGEIDVDLENFEADELTTYSVTNTKTDEVEEMSVELQSVNYDKNSKSLSVSKKISLGSAAAGTVTVKLSNIKLSHKEKGRQAEAIITANSTVTTEVSFDFGSYVGIPSSLVLGTIPVAGVGDITLSMDYSLKGGVAMTWNGEIKAGVTYNNGDLRIVKGYKKTGFSFTAEAAITAGLKLSAGVDLKAIKGIIYATVGVKMNFSVKGFDSGTPKTCVTIKGYLYATVGADVSVFGKSIPIKPQGIFNESNSPVRAVYHYEDNVLVSGCTRGLNLKYTTSTNSKYFNPSPSYGSGSYGGGSGTSEPVVIWEYKVEDDGNATITSYKGTASAVAVPSTIDGYKVTKIGASAFKNNKNLYSVTMPNSVTEIGNSAFYNCTNLSNLKLPSNITTLGCQTFYGCDSLTEIYIPKTLQVLDWPFSNSGVVTAEFEYGITTIPDDIFNGASKLKYVEIPETVTEIGSASFKECTALETIKLPEYIVKIGNSAFYNCTNLSNLKLPSNITTLGCQTFYGCDSLTEIYIPKTLQVLDWPFSNSGVVTAEFEYGITTIPDDIFNGASKLKYVEIPETVTEIGSASFKKCTALETIKIPETVTEIGDGVFQGCTSLKEISIPDSVTDMGTYIFDGCTSLTKVKLPSVRYNITYDTFRNCKSLTDIVLPSTVTAIRSNAFYGCESLTSLELPSGVQTIESSAFENCKALKNISIPEKCENIWNNAFKSCTSLAKVDMQYGLKNIYSGAFYECEALNNVSIPDSVTSIGSQAFYGCDSLSDVQFGIGIKEIPDSAFRRCPALVEIALPRYCTKVASNAFAENTKMTKVTVFPSMTSIENNSFSYPAKMTMRGVSGSYAQTYAKNRNMTFEAINNPITGLKFYKDSLDFSGTWETKVLPLNILPSDSTADITYTSADENIATVENGVVKSVGYGTTTITAQSGSRKATITINVLRSANSVSLDKTELSMEVGDKATLKATMNPSNATDKLTWSTSNASVVTVDNGNVTAVGTGKATVIVTTTSGKTASCTVEVTGSFTITAEAGENGTISPSGVKSVKSNEKVTYNITPNYGYVVKDVFVNGKSVGAVETYTFNGITADSTIKAEFAKVNVTYANNSISISSNAELKNLKLIVAEYDDNNVLTNCNVKTVSANAGKAYTDTIKSKPNMKIMIWNSFDNMRPIWCN